MAFTKKMWFKKADQKTGLLLHHNQNIAEFSGKDKTDLNEFQLAQSIRETVVAKEERHLLHVQLQRVCYAPL